MSTATQPLPAVHTYEEADDLVVEIELPPDGRPHVELDLDQRLLTVKTPRPQLEEHEVWRIHADATPC